MKAEQRGNKIVFVKSKQNKEIEQFINGILRDLDVLKQICSDRNTEKFPSDIIERVIDKTENLKKVGGDIRIAHDYLEYVTENKEILDFFTKKIDEFQNQNDLFKQKQKLLKNFADECEKFMK